MPRRDINRHFADKRQEWTERKHALVERYFVPAAMKMKAINGRVALIDGYAGPNCYGGEVQGSTTIMVEAARRVNAVGGSAKVFACESDIGRHDSLRANLSAAIAEGILEVFQGTHACQCSEIRRRIQNDAAIVFLDPQTAAELTLRDDIMPWAKRQATDVLGIFMGGDACRVCASAAAEGRNSDKMKASLGDKWASATTEDDAYSVFFNALDGFKHYRGLYRLRKQEPQKDAYGVFGLSDNVHGMWLLSAAISKDWGVLKEYDFKRKPVNLFTEIDAENEKQRQFDDLVALCTPLVKADPTLSGENLGRAVFKTPIGLASTFGSYTATDFTNAAKKIREVENLTGRR